MYTRAEILLFEYYWQSPGGITGLSFAYYASNGYNTLTQYSYKTDLNLYFVLVQLITQVLL